MNDAGKDRMEGNWKQFKGRVRQAWGDVTDDEMERLKGKREEMVGRLQERSGKERQEVERELDRYSKETSYRF